MCGEWLSGLLPAFLFSVVEEVSGIFANVCDVNTDVVLARSLGICVSCELCNDLNGYTTDGKGGDVRATATVHGNPLIFRLGLHTPVTEECYFFRKSEFLADALDGAVDNTSVNFFCRILP